MSFVTLDRLLGKADVSLSTVICVVPLFCEMMLSCVINSAVFPRLRVRVELDDYAVVVRPSSNTMSWENLRFVARAEVAYLG